MLVSGYLDTNQVIIYTILNQVKAAKTVDAQPRDAVGGFQ